MAIENPTAKLKPVMDEVFKFAPGDVVGWKTTLVALEAESRLNGPLKRDPYSPRVGIGQSVVMITERLVVECHGGTQIQYTVHSMRDGANLTSRAFEYELVATEEIERVVRKMYANGPVPEAD